MVIKPSVGRVVLFIPHETKYEFGIRVIKGHEHAAIVTHVHSENCVNLAVFDVNGKTFPASSVYLLQPGVDGAVVGSYCRWMDYQIEQAVKHAAQDAAKAVAAGCAAAVAEESKPAAA